MAHGYEERAEAPRRGWDNHFAWYALVAVAWLIYELTAQPGLCAPVACAKFGWNDFLTALWLRRNDPNPSRGRACYWFYIASGLWKIALMAFFLMIAILFIAGMLEPQPQRRGGHFEAEVLSAYLAAFTCFTLSGLITLQAVLTARRAGVKVWLDTAVHQARREDVWPPPYADKNRARRLLWTALVVLLIVLTFLLVTLTVLGAVLIRAWLGKVVIAFVPIAIMVEMIVAVITGLALRDVVRRIAGQVIAATPEQCWPTREERRREDDYIHE